MNFLPLSAAAITISPPFVDQLFMEPGSDPQSPWGLINGRPSALVKSATMVPPAVNYSAGSTVFASFAVIGSPGTYEVFVACGRPGEPIKPAKEKLGGLEPRPDGVSVLRFTTTDFLSWTGGTVVLFLPDGTPRPGRFGDGEVWTVKSMDRNESAYLLMAYYGDTAYGFSAGLKLTEDCFRVTRQGGVFKDHDDTNLIWSRGTHLWVDMQIFGAPWLNPDGSRTICPHNLSDNGGCDGGPRVVTTRLSADGANFTGDFGCASPGPHEPFTPAKRVKCSVWDEANLIRPHPIEDPPEMQFYRVRPFYVGESGRLAAHALQYAASPAEMNNISDYGYWGPYCPDPARPDDPSATTMCHKGHGYGRMHGPHMMEEWWVGTDDQAGPEELSQWRRPYKRFRVVSSAPALPLLPARCTLRQNTGPR